MYYRGPDGHCVGHFCIYMIFLKIRHHEKPQTFIMPVLQDHANRHLTPQNKVKLKLTISIFQQATYNIHQLIKKSIFQTILQEYKQLEMVEHHKIIALSQTSENHSQRNSTRQRKHMCPPKHDS